MTTSKGIPVWLQTLLAAAILGFLVYRVEWASIAANLRAAKPIPILLALALTPLNLYLQASKWKVLVQEEVAGATTGAALKSVLAGMVAGMITPGRMGEVIRGVFFDVGDPITLSGAFLIDKLLNIVPLLLLAAALSHSSAGALAALPWYLACLLFVWLVMRPHWVHKLLSGRVGQAGGWISRFLAAFDNANPRAILNAILLSALIYGVVCLQFALLLRALTPVVGWAAAVSAFLAVYVAGSIPATPGGIGMREAGAVLALAAFAVPAAAAVNGSLLLFTINLALPSLAGTWVILRSGWRWKRPQVS